MAVTTVTSGLNQVKGINYTVITDSFSDWSSLSNDVYFYDKATSLPYYKNASGTVVSIFEEGGGGNTIYTADDSLTGNRAINSGTNSFNFTNGSNEVGFPTFNTHPRWSIDNGTTRWDLITANSSGSFNANEFGIANGSIIPIRIFNGDKVALGNISKASLNTNYSVNVKDGLLIQDGDLFIEDGQLKIETKTNQEIRTQNNQFPSFQFDNNTTSYTLGNADASSTTFNEGNFFIYNSSTAKTNFLLTKTGETIISNGATAVIGSEKISLQGHTLIKGADTLGTSSALQIYDGDGTPSELLSVKNNGTFAVKNSLQTSLFLDGSNGRNSMGMGNATNSNAFMSIRNSNNRPYALRLEDSSGNLQVHLGLSALFVHDSGNTKKHLMFAQGGQVQFQQYAGSSVIMQFNNIGSSHMLGGFAIGGATRDASSILDLQATNLGFLPPTMTTTQRDLISSPASGLTLYNTTTNKLNVYTGSAWETISSS